jgi:hypothetical protein
MHDLQDARDAQKRIACALSGLLRAGDVFEPVKLVIDPATGFPALSVGRWAIEDPDLSLYLPEDHPDGVQLSGTMREVDLQNHAAADRWMAYYGKPSRVGFGIFEIESYKRLDVVVDGTHTAVEHSFRSSEGALLRALRSRTDDLIRACRRLSGLEPESALAVGVDPFGLDVRVRFGVMRLEFPGHARTHDDATGLINAILKP